MTQVSDAPARTRAQISVRTLRKDNWKQAPIVTATLLTIWVTYATVRVFTGHWYWVPQYQPDAVLLAVRRRRVERRQAWGAGYPRYRRSSRSAGRTGTSASAPAP